MGDRGNIVVRSEHGDVWLYSHWGGTRLKDVLRDVLAKQERWDDASYLARMIFSAMTNVGQSSTTGFGISTYMVDNEHGILVVDVSNQKVCRMEESALVTENGVMVLPELLDYRVSRTFEQYAANGFKKCQERRIHDEDRRVKKQPCLRLYSVYDRRQRIGRRKAD